MADLANAGLVALRFLWLFFFSMYCVLESIVKVIIPREYLRKDIKGQIVLVTGGGSGIGRLMCLKFAAKGAKIVTWDVNTDGNEETVRQVVDAGGLCRAYTVNLCDRKAVYATAVKVKQEVGKVDILVNNAGIVTGKKFMETADEDIIRTFEVNTLAHFWTVKAFLGDMLLSNRGHIVTVSSMCGWIGTNRLVDYCSSKFAAVGFHESLELELKVDGATGIKMTAICPIYINTGMFDGLETTTVPMLTPEWVATEIVDATLMEVSVLMLPKSVKLWVLSKHILPSKFGFKLAQIYGATKMMDNFVGRKKEH